MTQQQEVKRLRELVAAEVRATMARQQVTQVMLSHDMDRSQAFLSRRLTGEVAFDLDDLELIAGLLGVPVADLFPPALFRSSSFSHDRRTA
ncbi:MAG: helix-turn-helix transcriptional regulator [Acidimicrobiales bacterium]|nr:helix-turn-helix transcriptional regulator [Acidimicrobiales bacterium]